MRIEQAKEYVAEKLKGGGVADPTESVIMNKVRPDLGMGVMTPPAEDAQEAVVKVKEGLAR